MMKRYPAYKDSGVEWLGEVPEHWEMKSIKRVAHLKSGESITANQIEDEGTFKVYGGNGLRGYSSAYTHEGDYVLIGRQGALCGNVNYATGRFWASEHAVVATLLEENEVHWFGELLRAMNLNQYSVAAAQPGLSVDRIQNLLIPVPPVSEQRAIAAYLDCKTQEIDTLIEKKQALIALLQEQRTALINRAVTKGLNPDAPMKDSGIEWLGEVPAHWGIKYLKYACVLQRGIDLPSSERTHGKIPVYGGGGVSGFHNVAAVEGPGVVTGRYGTIGEVHYVDQDYWPLNTSLYIKEFWGNIPRYIYFMLSQVPIKANSGKSAVPGVDRNDVHEMRVALPPSHEQAAIIAHIDSKISEIDALVQREQALIELLQELRTSLISEVVTGKIDVREAVPA